MFDPEEYINKLTKLLISRFGKRLVYVGLQGSYLRNEATEFSDIDVMAVIDELRSDDLRVYRETIALLENREKSCGFICGRSELKNWNPLEICHLLHTTRDYYGKLSELVPCYTREDVSCFVKLSLGNLYHELCHRAIHSEREKNVAALPRTYKSAFFILQDMHWLESGNFMGTKRELLSVLEGKDRLVLETCISLGDGAEFDFDGAFELLFSWCKEALERIQTYG